MKIRRVTTEIVLLDLVGFSKLMDEEQYVAIQWVEFALKKELALLPALGGRPQGHFLLGTIPTGDGVYLLLHPELPGYGILCALALRALLLIQISRGEAPFKGVRLAVTLGTAIPYRDLTGRLNFVGGGLNACARLLQPGEVVEQAFIRDFAGDDNWLVAGESAVAAFQKRYPMESPDIASFLQTLKIRFSEDRTTVDKHGDRHVYQAVEASRCIAVSPPPFSHLSADVISDLDRYLEGLKQCPDPPVD